MRCHVCQSELAENSRFCKQCGTPVPEPAHERRCPVCFSVVRPGAAFCNSCGSALTAQPAAPAAPRNAQPKRRKKKTPYGLIVALLAALIVLGGSVGILLHILDDPGGKEAQSQSDKQDKEDQDAADDQQPESNDKQEDNEPAAEEKEETTEEVMEEESVTKDLLDYMGMDIDQSAAEIGDMFDPSTDYVPYYTNDIIEFISFQDNSKIDYVSIMAESNFCIAGISFGMDAETAYGALEDQGYSLSSEESNTRYFVNNENIFVGIEVNEGKVTYITGTSQSISEAEPAAEDLRNYIGSDLYYVAVKMGGMTGNNTSTMLIYSDKVVSIGAPLGGSTIAYASIINECNYSIADVQYGMPLDEACSILEERGFSSSYRDGSTIWYYDEEGNELLLGHYDNAITSIEIKAPSMLAEEEDHKESLSPTSEYLLPESNSRYLTYEDLEDLTHEELCFARNEIYARHGWIFSVPQLAEYFAGKSWYEGTTLPASFNSGVLNEFENANIQTISGYESLYYGGSYY